MGNPVKVKFGGVFYFRDVPTDGYMGVFWRYVFAGSNPVIPTHGKVAETSISVALKRLRGRFDSCSYHFYMVIEALM